MQPKQLRSKELMPIYQRNMVFQYLMVQIDLFIQQYWVLIFQILLEILKKEKSTFDEILSSHV